jgi:hypothetical protein
MYISRQADNERQEFNQFLSTTLLRLLCRDQIPQRQIVHHILDLLDGILDGIHPLPQDVVLEVEHLEPGMQVLDEPANLHRHGGVAQRHRVNSQAAEVVDDGNQPQQVLLDGDVEGITVLEVDRDCRRSVFG